MRTQRVGLLAVSLLIAAGVAAACGSDDNKDKTVTRAAGTTPAASSSAASGSAVAGSPVKATITARDFSFSSTLSDAKKGDTVQIDFKNDGSATHTLTFYSDDGYTTKVPNGDSGRVAAGGSASLSVVAGDGLYYRCEIHPSQMKGEIELS
jgi:plastocyanin